MKSFIFVSDFDGTVTKKDFYRILIDNYLTDSGEKIYIDWQSGKIKDIDALELIYNSTGRTEPELFEDILSIELDPFFEEFVSKIKTAGGDFLILSAGTSYYINRFFEHKGIKDIKVISNRGEYQNKGIHLIVDKESPYYSEMHGIDKAKVVQSLKNEYSKIYYAGDSRPDIGAAKIADIAFATGNLVKHLDGINQPYIPFKSLKDIYDYLLNLEVIKNA